MVTQLGKMCFTESMEKVFVGFRISTHRKEGPWISVLPSKLHKLCQSIITCLSSKVVTARQLARVTGQCISMTKAILPAKLILRNCYRCLKNKESWDSEIQLTKSAVKDLEWWLTALKGWNRAPLTSKVVDLQVRTDASSAGWGGTVTSKQGEILDAAGLWSREISYKHSNFRELMAVYMALL